MLQMNSAVFKQFKELTDGEIAVLTQLMFEFESFNVAFLNRHYRLRLPGAEVSMEAVGRYIQLLREEDVDPSELEGLTLIYSKEQFCVGYIWWRSSSEIENAIDFDQIYVSPLYRKQGYASKALQETMTYITKLSNITKFCLEAYTQNIGALKLYRKLGFDQPLKTVLYKG